MYFSNFFKTFGEFFFVKGTFSCESAICINKSVNKLFPEKVKFKKKDYHFRTEVVLDMSWVEVGSAAAKWGLLGQCLVDHDLT